MKNWLKIKHEGFFTSKIQVSKYMDWKNGETVDRIKHSWFALKKTELQNKQRILQDKYQEMFCLEEKSFSVFHGLKCLDRPVRDIENKDNK